MKLKINTTDLIVITAFALGVAFAVVTERSTSGAPIGELLLQGAAAFAGFWIVEFVLMVCAYSV